MFPYWWVILLQGKKKDRGVWKRVGVVKHSHGNDLLDFYILKIVFFVSFFFKHTIDTASSLHINASRTVYLLWLLGMQAVAGIAVYFIHICWIFSCLMISRCFFWMWYMLVWSIIIIMLQNLFAIHTHHFCVTITSLYIMVFVANYCILVQS